MCRIAAIHFGLSCKSFTIARERILRDRTFPRGRPGLSPGEQKIVDLGNRLVGFTGELAMLLVRGKVLLTLENPWLSTLWYQHEILRL